jgi:hypothetical protein
MPDQDRRVGSQELQFDRVIHESGPATASGFSSDAEGVAVVCAACAMSIDTEYYHINGHHFCSRCRDAVESAAETPLGIGVLLRAGAFGLAAGVAGAVIYYSVIAITNLEIGLVAILIGYMVGYAVRRGARGHGGLRFQVLAVALTYASVALAYVPLAIGGAREESRDAKSVASVATGQESAAVNRNAGSADPTPPNVGLLGALALMMIFTIALPVLVVVGSLPFGLISGFIIFLGMSQAWKMTGSPLLQVFGPYRVGAKPIAVTS